MHIPGPPCTQRGMPHTQGVHLMSTLHRPQAPPRPGGGRGRADLALSCPFDFALTRCPFDRSPALLLLPLALRPKGCRALSWRNGGPPPPRVLAVACVGNRSTKTVTEMCCRSLSSNSSRSNNICTAGNVSDRAGSSTSAPQKSASSSAPATDSLLVSVLLELLLLELLLQEHGKSK